MSYFLCSKEHQTCSQLSKNLAFVLTIFYKTICKKELAKGDCASSTNGTRKNGWHIEKNEGRPLLSTLHKKSLEIDWTPMCKTQNYKIDPLRHRGNLREIGLGSAFLDMTWRNAAKRTNSIPSNLKTGFQWPSGKGNEIYGMGKNVCKPFYTDGVTARIYKKY